MLLTLLTLPLLLLPLIFIHNAELANRQCWHACASVIKVSAAGVRHNAQLAGHPINMGRTLSPCNTVLPLSLPQMYSTEHAFLHSITPSPPL